MQTRQHTKAQLVERLAGPRQGAPVGGLVQRTTWTTFRTTHRPFWWVCGRMLWGFAGVVSCTYCCRCTSRSHQRAHMLDAHTRSATLPHRRLASRAPPRRRVYGHRCQACLCIDPPYCNIDIVSLCTKKRIDVAIRGCESPSTSPDTHHMFNLPTLFPSCNFYTSPPLIICPTCLHCFILQFLYIPATHHIMSNLPTLFHPAI